MATVELGISDLSKLVGKKLSRKQAEEACAMLGMPLEKCEGDSMVLEISPNRPDWLCVEGVARSIASFLSIKTGLRPYKFEKPVVECEVEAGFLASRPHAAAAVARNVPLSDELVRSMMQLQEKLCDTMGRKRRKLSMGAYDISKLKPPFRYAGCVPSEVSFVPLSMSEKLNLSQILERHPKGQQYSGILKPFEKYPVIFDSTGDVLCLIPITNGESSRVEAGGNCDLFLEVNGTDARTVEFSLNILCAQLADRGAKIEQVKFTGAISAVTPQPSSQTLRVTPQAVSKLLGVTLTPDEIASCLEKMGFAAKAESHEVVATIPSYRTDVFHECDLVEDVGIAYGYQHFKGRQPPFTTIGARHPVEAFADKLRAAMTGLGFQDCVTFTLTNEETHYSRLMLPPSERVEIANPLTQETTMVRTSVLPSLLSVLEANKGEKYPQRLFEAGDVVILDSGDNAGCSTRKTLCAVIASKGAGLAEIKSALEALVKELGIECKFSHGQQPFFVPTRSAIVSGPKVSGYYGEIRPQVLENFGLEMPVAAFELRFEPA